MGDPNLPFILLHNEVVVPSHSFVRIPARFIPVSRGRFYATIYGHVAGFDDECISIQFIGEAV